MEGRGEGTMGHGVILTFAVLRFAWGGCLALDGGVYKGKQRRASVCVSFSSSSLVECFAAAAAAATLLVRQG